MFQKVVCRPQKGAAVNYATGYWREFDNALRSVYFIVDVTGVLQSGLHFTPLCHFITKYHIFPVGVQFG